MDDLVKSRGQARFESTPFVTWGLVIVNIVVFVMEIVYQMHSFQANHNPLNVNTLNITSGTLLHFGAKYGPLIQQGQTFRLFAPMFVHLSILHLAFNMAALISAGRIVEKQYGHVRLLLFYLIAGFTGNVMSYVANPQIISAGASTSIFGLMGALLVLFVLKSKSGMYALSVSKSALSTIGVNLIYNLVQPGIDIWGHLGGLLGGVSIALLTGLKFKDMSAGRRLVSIFLGSVGTILFLYVLQYVKIH